MPLNPGDIAFVGFNADGSDNLAFVALADIAPGETLYFEDNEWNGAGFNDTNEGAFSWTASEAVLVGTVVTIDNIGSGTISASRGTVATPVAGRGTNRGISTGDETIYVYQGSPGTPVTFITAIANGGFSAANGLLTNTGLVAGTNALDLSLVDDDADVAAYDGSRSGQADFSAYRTLINNPINWLTQDGTGDQSADGAAPDLPFSTAAFELASVPPGSSIDLSTYVRVGRYDLPVPTRNAAPTNSQLALEASAVTYNPDTDSLFLVGDEGTAIVQVSKTGQLIDSMTLESGAFDDPEGLTYAGDGQFILIEERSRQANRFTYRPNVTLTRNEVETVKLGTTIGNVGLEGISADPQTGGFVLVKEIDPQGVFQTEIDFAAGTASNGSATTENAINLFDPALMGLTDIADVYALANLPAQNGAATDGNLLVLSQEDGRIVNVDRQGGVTSSLAIAADPGNPLSVADQGHEGLTMDGDRVLYVVSEQGGGDSDHPQLWVYAPASAPLTNQAPVAVSLANALTSLAENSDTAAPIKIGTIIISDDSLGDNRLSLTGADADAFEIVGQELFLKAGTVLDFETQPRYDIVITVDDATLGGTPDASRAFSLALTDTTDGPAALIISEVAPWSSGNSPGVGADWFEVTNVSTAVVDITGWRIDDDSASFANSTALAGVTRIEPGQSVVFVDGDEATVTAFVTTWFGGVAPSGVVIGTYGGPGLGTGGDGVNLFDASGTLVTGVTFGASPTGPFATFDNKDGLPAVSALSVAGVNGAFSILDGAVLIGSPGTTVGSSLPLPTLVAIEATDATAAEAGQNPGLFTVRRTGDSSAALEVTYTISGDATNGTDYVAIDPTRVTIPAGSSEAVITITPVEDGDAEATEAVTLTLVDGAAYDLTADVSATVAIADNDTPLADFNLQITEIWSGQAGADVTADWFEITNRGTEAWVAGVAPDLFYDDDSADPAAADPILGLNRIEPGKSAIVVVGGPGDAAAFREVWGAVIDLSGVEVGSTDGAGLGNGDAVTLFVGVPAANTIADNEAYPDPRAFDAASYDVDGAGFTVAGQNGAIATLALGGDGGNVPAVGSPGNGAAIVAIDNRNVVINEVDADTPGSDGAEFVELYDGGAGNTPLDGLSVVFFNGSNDLAYAAFDLDGLSTDANGYFVLGNPGVANVDLTFEPGGSGLLQNGADAVALYRGDAADFPSGAAATTANLQDAIAYDTSDSDDAGLLAALGLTTQFDENANGQGATESNSRVPNGSGSFVAQAPTPGAENVGVVTPPPPPSGITLISAIQGSASASPLVGSTVTVEAIVTGDFQDGAAGTNGDLNGFYIQEEASDEDGNAATSEGLFVFEPSLIQNVNPGDRVRITGVVSEFFGETQLTASAIAVIGSGAIAPVTVELPVVQAIANSDGLLIADLEQYEGMLVRFNQALTVDEYFNYDRFGEIRLSEGGRPFQFTQTNQPSTSGFQAFQAALARRTIALDDGQTIQNPNPLVYPSPAFSDSNFFRGGDSVTGLTGNVRFSRGSGGSGDEIYRIMPTETVSFSRQNPRPSQPEAVGGSLKVVSFNVLNYFSTIDTPGTSTANGSDPRGADSQAEFERQTAKLVTTILAIDADILGLVELENDFLPGSSGNAIQTLVNRLNAIAGSGTYDWVNPGQQFIDASDAISVGAIYKTASVTLANGTSPAILRDSNLPAGFEGETLFDGPNTNRAPLAVTFEQLSNGETFTISVNHLKSKGSIFDAPGNTDIGDGQGNNNAIRLRAAQAIAAWLATRPTGTRDDDVLLLGDLNAYANEDPITYLESQGYVDLAERFADGTPYSFLFDGQLGTLDYALANAALASQVTGATEWHVNADEADALDYNLDFGRDPSLFNGDNPFRNSDHDPLIVGLNLQSQPPSPTTVNLGLYNAVTDQLIQLLQEGDVIQVSQLGTSLNNLSIVAIAPSGGALPNNLESVKFNLNGTVLRTENIEPYALFGDQPNNNFNPGTLPAGRNRITADLFTGNQGAGALIDSLTINFTLELDGEPPTPANIELGLFDASSDRLIQVLNEGDVINTSNLPTGLNNLTIVAFRPDGGTLPSNLESVVFDLNGRLTQTENLVPYALFGDRSSTDFNGGPIPLGSNRITAQLFDQDQGRGNRIDSLTRNFSIVGEAAPQADLEIGLYDADTNELIELLEDGDSLKATQIEGRSLTIAAVVPSNSVFGTSIESMRLDFNNGQLQKLENIEPYALFGDDPRGDFNGGSLSLGESNRISFSLFSRDGGTGSLLGTVTRTFQVEPADVG